MDGRNMEYQLLTSKLRDPERILVITGPRDCGKSALLKHFAMERWGVCLIDLRSSPTSNPTVGTTLRRVALAYHACKSGCSSEDSKHSRIAQQ
jgi:predicted AAA+ superfamily ATPase